MRVLLMFCALSISFSYGIGKEMFSDAESWPKTEDMQQADQKEDGMLEALMGSVEEACYGRRCAIAGDCCQGSVCVDVDGVSGTCLPMYGKKEGESCDSDSDCEFGLSCRDSGNSAQSKVCQLEERNVKRKAYNDECVTSSECDTNRGLCCQILRRHRMASKKVCHYFIDPESCIGKLETKMKPLHFIPNPFFKARLG